MIITRLKTYSGNIAIVLQARSGSKRFPYKVLHPIQGIPLLSHCIRRLRRVCSDVPLIVATTQLPADDAIVELATREKAFFYRGSEDDVLDRYYSAAKKYKAGYVIRATGDNPFVDVEEAQRLLSYLRTNKWDYISMKEETKESSLPLGVGLEAFSFPALKRSWQKGKEPHHREHVNEYILENLHEFKAFFPACKKGHECPSLRLSVDTKTDLKFINKMLSELRRPAQDLSLREMIDWWMDKKLIYIRLDANHKVGLGHLFRMFSLAEIAREFDYELLFILRKNSASEKLLSLNEFRYFSVENWLSEEEVIKKTLEDNRKPDLWIFDLLDIKNEWVLMLKNSGIPTVCVDDLGSRLRHADVVFNAILNCSGEAYEDGAGGFSLGGPEYALLSQNIIKYRKDRIVPHAGPLVIGVTMGGSDTYASTVLIARALVANKKDIKRAHFFLGPSFQDEERLNDVLAWCEYDFAIERSVPDLFKRLDVMDVIICAGGMTLFEVCAMGLPVLAFVNEPHEEKTILFFVNQNACINLGSIRNPDIGELGVNIGNVLKDREALKVMAHNGKKIVSLDGARRAFRVIEEKCLL